MSLFKSKLLPGPKWKMLFCPLCHTPMTWKEGKVPDNFYCFNAAKIVKIEVKDGEEEATKVLEESKYPIGESSLVAKEDALFVSGAGPLRMARRVFRHLWPGERTPSEENEDNDRGRVHPRQG